MSQYVSKRDSPSDSKESRKSRRSRRSKRSKRSPSPERSSRSRSRSPKNEPVQKSKKSPSRRESSHSHPNEKSEKNQKKEDEKKRGKKVRRCSTWWRAIVRMDIPDQPNIRASDVKVSVHGFYETVQKCNEDFIRLLPDSIRNHQLPFTVRQLDPHKMEATLKVLYYTWLSKLSDSAVVGKYVTCKRMYDIVNVHFHQVDEPTRLIGFVNMQGALWEDWEKAHHAYERVYSNILKPSNDSKESKDLKDSKDSKEVTLLQPTHLYSFPVAGGDHPEMYTFDSVESFINYEYKQMEIASVDQLNPIPEGRDLAWFHISPETKMLEMNFHPEEYMIQTFNRYNQCTDGDEHVLVIALKAS